MRRYGVFGYPFPPFCKLRVLSGKLENLFIILSQLALIPPVKILFSPSTWAILTITKIMQFYGVSPQGTYILVAKHIALSLSKKSLLPSAGVKAHFTRFIQMKKGTNVLDRRPFLPIGNPSPTTVMRLLESCFP